MDYKTMIQFLKENGLFRSCETFIEDYQDFWEEEYQTRIEIYNKDKNSYSKYRVKQWLKYEYKKDKENEKRS